LRLLDRCVDDIKRLLLPPGTDIEESDHVGLQTDEDVDVVGGRNYGVVW
jgi:CRISPR-associated protein Cas1